MATPVTVGLIGLGRSGWGIHAQALAKDPRFQVVAVADPEADRRQVAQERFRCAVYQDCEELLAHSSPELLVVTTPSHTHACLAIAAMEQGCHVLVEKPMATSADEASQMIDAAHRTGRLLTVFQCRRFDADFQAIQTILRQGRLGPVHLVRMGRYGYMRRNDWQTLRKYGGGMLANWGAHLIDQALLLLDGVATVGFADLKRVASAGDAEDHVKLTLCGSHGTIVDIEITSGCALPLPEWVVMGKYGSVVGNTKELRLKAYDPESLPEPVVIDGPAPGWRYGTGETIPWEEEKIPIQPNDTAALFYDALYGALREGTPLPVTPESVRRQLEIMDQCRDKMGTEKLLL